jgi:hypothetical protein
MKVILGDHAEAKLELLKSRGFPVSKEQVIDCVEKPDRIDEGYKGRKIAQKGIDPEHVLRVVFTELEDQARVVTVYPGRRRRYENDV